MRNAEAPLDKAWRRAVTGEERERLMRLCEQAAVEQDSQRLLELVRQINDLLEAKEARLKKRDKERAAGH